MAGIEVTTDREGPRGRLATLEERGWPYILGARMRAQKEVRDEVLGRAGRYRVVHPKRRSPKEPSPLKVKEVWVEDRRYIGCLNEEQANKDAADRCIEPVLAAASAGEA